MTWLPHYWNLVTRSFKSTQSFGLNSFMCPACYLIHPKTDFHKHQRPSPYYVTYFHSIERLVFLAGGSPPPGWLKSKVFLMASLRSLATSAFIANIYCYFTELRDPPRGWHNAVSLHILPLCCHNSQPQLSFNFYYNWGWVWHTIDSSSTHPSIISTQQDSNYNNTR